MPLCRPQPLLELRHVLLDGIFDFRTMPSNSISDRICISCSWLLANDEMLDTRSAPIG